MQKLIVVILIVATVSACASHVPIIDTKGVDMNAYHSDLVECQQIAEQVSPAASAAGGAVAGALFGALLGAAIGGRGGAGYGAKIGTAEGVGVGAAGGAVRQVQVVNRCMAGRGYKVLG